METPRMIFFLICSLIYIACACVIGWYANKIYGKPKKRQ